MNQDDLIPLPEYQVTAVPGHGVYIVGEGDSCWCVGGVPRNEEPNNELAQAYLEAVGSQE